MLANVALPSFLPHSFATLIGIFAIAAIEGWFVMRILRLGYAESYRHALNANWKSTIAGSALNRTPLCGASCFGIGLLPMSSIIDSTAGTIIKSDRVGRTRYSAQHKQEVLDAFESSSLSAPDFAQQCGIK